MFLALGLLCALALPEEQNSAPVHYAPPHLLRPAYRVGFPRNPWWHRFDPYLRKVSRRDNRIASLGGIDALPSRELRVVYFGGVEANRSDAQWLRTFAAVESRNAQVEPLEHEIESLIYLVRDNPDVIHATGPNRWLGDDAKSRLKGWLTLLAFALARRRGSVLIASIQEHESGDTQPDTHARAFFDRMVDAAIYASASHASEVREKRPKLSVARSYVLRYGHFAGASVPDLSLIHISEPTRPY